jgi:spore germination protein
VVIYVVKAGDSIYKIAREYGVSVESIVNANGLRNPENLVVGESLVIPAVSRSYTVEPGDSLYSISRQFNVSLAQLRAANPQITNPNMIYPGQTVQIPSGSGDTPWGTLAVNGYSYPTINQDILNAAMPGLSYLSIFSYQVLPDGSLSTMNEQPLINTVRANNIAPKMVITNIAEDGFSSSLAETILTDTAVQDRLLENVAAVMRQKNYTGLNVDFEYIYPRNREDYNRFMEKARGVMDANGWTLSSALAPKVSSDQPGLLYEAHDYAAHGRIADFVILMTYEWGYLKGPPLPVAPLNQVRRVIEYAVTQIPPNKILMGIPNYGYDWTLPFVPGSSATVLTNPGAVELAFRVGAQIKFDPAAQSPYFNYYDSNGREHIVWFEDARSIYAKMELVREFGLKGVSYWTINTPFQQNWTIVNTLWNVQKM